MVVRNIGILTAESFAHNLSWEVDLVDASTQPQLTNAVSTIEKDD